MPRSSFCRKDYSVSKKNMKTFWQSKTNWFNILSTLITVLGAVQGSVPPSAMPWIVFAIGVVNLILRTFFTSTAIG